MITTLRLNHRLIGARAREMGLSAEAVRKATGFRLADLESDPDQRTVTLAMLARLHGLLGLAVEQLLVVGPAHQSTEHTAGRDDGETEANARVLLAALAVHNPVEVETLLAVSGWSPAELDAALARVRAQLAGTGLTVTGNDLELRLSVGPGALPDSLRAALAGPATRRHGLDAATAIDLLRLVRKEILRPVPGVAVPVRASPDVGRDAATRRLLDAGVAVGRGVRAGEQVGLVYDGYDGIDDTGHAAAGLRIHPDVMFALGLAARPAARRQVTS